MTANRLGFLEFGDPLSKGVPVVFLHGFLGSLEDWRPVASNLDVRSVGINLPGHAGSPPVEGKTSWFDETCLALGETLGEIGISRIHLVGYSLGGRIAMHFAKRNPEMIEGMILESCHPGLYLEDEREARIRHDASWSFKFAHNWPEVLKEWCRQDLFASPGCRKPDIIKLRGHHNPEHIASAMNGFSLGKQSLFWEWERVILYVCGQHDHKFVRIGQRMTENSSQISLCEIEGAGHNTHLEQPEAYLEAIAKHLELDLK